MSETTNKATAAPPPSARFVRVWTHVLNDFEDFPDAIAVVENGVLLVGPLGVKEAFPIKGYAPGAWLTFEHVGDYNTPRPAAPRLVDETQEITRLMDAAPPAPDDPPTPRRAPIVDSRRYGPPKAPGGWDAPAATPDPTTPRRRWSRHRPT